MMETIVYDDLGIDGVIRCDCYDAHFCVMINFDWTSSADVAGV